MTRTRVFFPALIAVAALRILPRRLPARRRPRRHRRGAAGAVPGRHQGGGRHRRRQAARPARPPPSWRRRRSRTRPTSARSRSSPAAPASIRCSQLGSVTVAFPEEARAHGEMGLVLRADNLDETRLVAYARDQLQKSGDDLVATPHGRFTLWSSKRDPDVVGFFIDRQTFALGAGGWGAKMADLAESARPVDSAATDVDLDEPGRAGGRVARAVGGGDRPRVDAQVAAADPAVRRRGRDPDAVGGDRSRQGARRACCSPIWPPRPRRSRWRSRSPRRCATPSGTRRC